MAQMLFRVIHIEYTNGVKFATPFLVPVENEETFIEQEYLQSHIVEHIKQGKKWMYDDHRAVNVRPSDHSINSFELDAKFDDPLDVDYTIYINCTVGELVSMCSMPTEKIEDPLS